MLARKYVNVQECITAVLSVEDALDKTKSPYFTIPAAAYSIFKAVKNLSNITTNKGFKKKIVSLEELTGRYFMAQVQIKTLAPKIKRSLLDGALAAKILQRIKKNKNKVRVNSRPRRLFRKKKHGRTRH